MPPFSADCLDQWLASFDDFRYEFLRHCTLLCKVCGYYFDFNQQLLEIAHKNWKAQCDLWQASRIMKDSSHLSHLKIAAILIQELSDVEWVTNLYEYDPSSEILNVDFSGTSEEREEVRKDINAGRGTYLGFQFVMQVLNWFEQARIDRAQPFIFRMTSDLEHDIMVYLLSEYRNAMAIFLTLKALYVRDEKI
jgi:hypothetical protein